MKYGISSLLARGLAGAMLLGSGCIVVVGDGMDDDTPAAAPRITLIVDMPSGAVCTVFSGSPDAACDGAIAPSERAVVAASVEWGAHAPGPIEVSDACGGSFQLLSRDPLSLKAEWAPPATEGACVITARAASTDGAGSQLSAVVAVQAGGTQPAAYPRVSGKLSHAGGACLLDAGQTGVSCSEPVRAGDVIQASVDIDWGNLTQSQIAVTSSCGGEWAPPVDDGSSFQSAWLAPLIDTTDCWATFEAFSLEGPSTVATLYYSVVDGQPPGEVYAYVYFEHAGGQCYINPGAFVSDCAPAAAGETTLVYVEIDWGKYDAGSITVSDNCDGSFTNTFSSSTNKQLDWELPSVPTTCMLLVEAITADGQSDLFAMDVPVN